MTWDLKNQGESAHHATVANSNRGKQLELCMTLIQGMTHILDLPIIHGSRCIVALYPGQRSMSCMTWWPRQVNIICDHIVNIIEHVLPLYGSVLPNTSTSAQHVFWYCCQHRAQSIARPPLVMRKSLPHQWTLHTNFFLLQ